MSRIDNLEKRVADLERNVGSAMGERRTVMSRIDNLEKRVADLERNVGLAMGELGLTAITTREASGNYREGMNKPVKMINSAIAEQTPIDMLKGEIRGLQIANDMLETENKQLKKMMEDLVRMKP